MLVWDLIVGVVVVLGVGGVVCVVLVLFLDVGVFEILLFNRICVCVE